MVETDLESRSEAIVWRNVPPGNEPRAGTVWPRPGEVHLFLLSLSVSAGTLRDLSALLAPEELDRAARYVFDVHRVRYIAGRAILRRVLASYLQVQPGTLGFVYGPQGKPSLAGQGNGLQFNLAHSENVGLLAVTRGEAVGVDVECIRILDDFDELVGRFFSRRESATFQRLAPELKPTSFFNLWTRKEALLKATGDGIAHCLKEVEVSFLPGEPAQLLGVPSHFGRVEEWNLHDLRCVEPGFAAAVAIRRAKQ
jgi:4'-phosphopantetheinyl transferase